MRILHVSDLHANTRWYQWLVSASHSFDLVCITGDLVDVNGCRTLPPQVDDAIHHIRSLRSTLVAVCSGNHDSFPDNAGRFRHARWLKEIQCPHVLTDGDRLERDGMTFRCVGWNSPLPTPTSNELWLHHAPPDGLNTAIDRGGASFGSIDLGDLCRGGRGPRLVLSGHVHDPISWRARTGKTCSLNPGFAANAAFPNHVVIDLQRNVAAYRSANGHEAVVRLT